jgi:NADH-quinone oxidoreductase subunit F
MSKNLSELSGREGLAGNLFERLGQSAERTGTPSQSDMALLAEDFLMGTANVYGTASFYDFTKPENQGKRVYVCNGSACLTAGTQPALRQALGAHFEEDSIGEMCCLGRCHENSAFFYHDHNYSGTASSEIQSICTEEKVIHDRYHTQFHGTPVLMRPFPGVEDYYQTLHVALHNTPDGLLQELKDAGLRGRGGAGFPIAFKLESCKITPGVTKFIVCNADEGDPGAYSDRYLLEHHPHAILLGMIIAGYITGAQMGVLYVRGEYPEVFPILEQALVALRGYNLIGKNILASGFDFDFKVIRAQGAYICGEETALLNSIEGQRPEVRVRPPYPTQQGLFNKPTVVNNVETLACIPYIIEHSGKQFASIGRGRSTGTKLLSLDGHFNRPGVYEVDNGTPLSLVIEQLGGGFRHPIKAMHIGGPLGGLVPLSKVSDLTIDFESFAENGFLLGHGSIVCIPASFPLIDYLEHLFQFTAHESCGKCFPCRLGSTRGYELLQKSRTSDFKIDRVLFDDLLETLETGSLCALGGGLPLPVKNALQYFKVELEPYFV